MKRVTGIGGIFFNANDPVELRAWYKQHLGIDVQEWGGVAFTWTDAADNPIKGTTVWSIGAADGEPFAPSKSTFMINYRVEDLDALLQSLRDEGCNVLEKTDDSEYGKFGWVMDPEGNKIELWQPPPGAVSSMPESKRRRLTGRSSRQRSASLGLRLNFNVGRLAIVIKTPEFLEHVRYNFRQGVLPHTNSNKWKEIIMSQGESTTETATQKSAKSTTASNKKSEGFTDEEKAAMKERAKELKAEARAGKDKAEGENAVVTAIAAMQEPDRAMAARLHEIIKTSAPVLAPKTWYGMPAYAKDGKVVCFFQSAQKFNTRYATFGFSEPANLDEGAMWPVAYALTKLTATEEAKIIALVKKAVSS